MSKMTKERLAEIEARASKATPGPWECDDHVAIIREYLWDDAQAQRGSPVVPDREACERALAELEALQSPAAGPWIKIEPGCEMPQVGKRVLLLFPNGEVWCGSLYRHTADQDSWQWHCDKDRSRGWTGFNAKGCPTHYAVVRMPEET